MQQPNLMPKMPSLIVGIIALIAGVIPFLVKAGLIPALPEIPAIAFSIILAVGGLLLVLDAILGFTMM